MDGWTRYIYGILTHACHLGRLSYYPVYECLQSPIALSSDPYALLRLQRGARGCAGQSGRIQSARVMRKTEAFYSFLPLSALCRPKSSVFTSIPTRWRLEAISHREACSAPERRHRCSRGGSTTSTFDQLVSSVEPRKSYTPGHIGDFGMSSLCLSKSVNGGESMRYMRCRPRAGVAE